MPSTFWHSTRFSRILLLLGAFALALIVPASASHLACHHDDGPAADLHQCAVCRHLDDGTALQTAPAMLTAPTVVTALATPLVPNPVSPISPPARGRSPPAPVSAP